MNETPTTKTQSTRRSVELWQEIMSTYDSSGLTQESFCARESIALSTFYTWRQRLNAVKPTKVKSKTPQFVELTPTLTENKSRGWDIELSLGDDIILRLRRQN